MQETQEMWVRSLGQEDLLEEGMATHSSTLPWRIPWTKEPGGLQAIGSHRFGHDWSDFAHPHPSTFSGRKGNCVIPFQNEKLSNHVFIFLCSLQSVLLLKKHPQAEDTHMSPRMVLGVAPPWRYPGFRAWICARKAFSEVGDGTRSSNWVRANSESTLLSVSLPTSIRYNWRK